MSAEANDNDGDAQSEEEEYENFIEIEERFDNGDPKLVRYTKERQEEMSEFVQAMAEEDGPEERETDTLYSSSYEDWRLIRFEEADGEPDVQNVNF